VQYESGGEKVNVTVEVPARSSVDVGFGENGQLFLPGIDTPPGGLLPVYFQYGDEQGRQVRVPVLDGALYPDYADLLPTPTPTPTPDPEDQPTEEPEG
jgi:hypothetical protein